MPIPADGRSETPLVLVVDDNALNAKLLRLVLGAAAFRVRVASTAARARQALADERFSLALVDVQLPEEDGLSLVRWMRERDGTRELPIVVVTAMVSEKDSAGAYAAGADEFVAKPIDTRAFGELARALVKHGRGATGREARVAI